MPDKTPRPPHYSGAELAIGMLVMMVCLVLLGIVWGALLYE